jgi:hypothetical protein
VVSPAGKETSVKLILLQLEKALLPIDVSEDGNVTEPKELQLEKALLPILVSPDVGNVRVVKALQPLNKEAGIVTSPVVRNVTDFRPIHPKKALVPILVTPLGIVIVALVSGHS